MQAPASLRAAQLAWNDLVHVTEPSQLTLDWGALPLVEWSAAAHDWRHRLLHMDDLTTQLTDFVQKKR